MRSSSELVKKLARLLMVVVGISGSRSHASGPVVAAMRPSAWNVKGYITFVNRAGYPGGVLRTASGSAELRDVSFADGTIEFDMDLVGHGIFGIRFRQRDPETADALFFRPSADCATSRECLQYMPYAHGMYQWDLFPEYESAAPLHAVGWNHVRMVVSGHRMNVYLNGAAKPSLQVGNLKGGSADGGIRLGGPASYANLIITPGKVDGLSPKAAPDPTLQDPRYLRHWLAAGPYPLAATMDASLQVLTGRQPSCASMPQPGPAWLPLQSERKGLVNLTRRFASARDAAVSVAWLKTTIESDRPQRRQVSLGFLREAWVYLNGSLVYTDRNLYGTPASKIPAHKGPDGRIALTNGTFSLPLRRGKNLLVIAVDDNFSGAAQHFGWGVQARLDRVIGLRLAE